MNVRYCIASVILIFLMFPIVDLKVVGECWTVGEFDGRYFAALGRLLNPVWLFVLLNLFFFRRDIGEKLVGYTSKLPRSILTNNLTPNFLVGTVLVLAIVPSVYLAYNKFHRVENRMNNPFFSKLALERCRERGVEIHRWGAAEL